MQERIYQKTKVDMAVDIQEQLMQAKLDPRLNLIQARNYLEVKEVTSNDLKVLSGRNELASAFSSKENPQTENLDDPSKYKRASSRTRRRNGRSGDQS